MKWKILTVAVLTCALLTMMITEVTSVRYIVGGNKGWTNNVNYTVWAQDKHFYTQDWLFFVYDRNQMEVLEVNKINYETCNTEHPLHNYTLGFGRDVVPVNVSRQYYFISSKKYCLGGMKLTFHVEKHSLLTLPPPEASPPSEAFSPLEAFLPSEASPPPQHSPVAAVLPPPPRDLPIPRSVTPGTSDIVAPTSKGGSGMSLRSSATIGTVVCSLALSLVVFVC